MDPQSAVKKKERKKKPVFWAREEQDIPELPTTKAACTQHTED